MKDISRVTSEGPISRAFGAGARAAFDFMGDIFGTKVKQDAVKDQLINIMEARREQADLSILFGMKKAETLT